MAGDITRILEHAGPGDRDAVDRLMPLVYRQIHGIAARQMRQEGADHTLQPTAVANEAYLRLVGERQIAWRNRGQFLAVMSRSIRQILINHANARNAVKRGGGARPRTLRDAHVQALSPETIDASSIENALRQLTELNARMARVVELRILDGRSVAETAEALGVSHRTVESDWRCARAWLAQRLADEIAPR